VTRQVNRDHLAIRGERRNDQLPRLPTAAEAVNKQERFAGAGAVNGEGHAHETPEPVDGSFLPRP
jgi:hypothetical protein